MSFVGILLLMIGLWLLIYIKMMSLIIVSYPKKTYLTNKLAIIIKYQNNVNFLNKLLQNIAEQSIKIDYDLYLFNIESNFFQDIRNLPKNYDGYIVLNSNSLINKNYFKELKKEIVKNYDIIYFNNNYYFKSNILNNSFTPYLENEEELDYYAIYYNLYVLKKGKYKIKINFLNKLKASSNKPF